MSFDLAERHDAALPTILHLPPDVHSLAAAEEAIEWGECYGLHLDPDQKATIYAACGERVDGSWAAAEVGDFKGRQAGKNDTIKVRQGAGIDLFGEKLIIHTAHEFPTANEDFLRLVAIYESFDDLRKTVSRVRYANGEQGIEFHNGARIKYKARTGGSGRGFTKADLVVYDEAQHLHSEHLAASLPTMLANPNFQAWFCGSGGLSYSTQAWKLRRRALMGNGGRFAYTENTAQHCVVDGEKISMSVPDDLIAEDVLMLHPGFAHGRVSREAMETMYLSLGPDKFAREILCVWEPEPEMTDAIIDPARWHDLVDGDSVATDDTFRLTLDAPPDRRSATFGAAGKRADNLAHVQVRYHVAPHEMRDLVVRAKELCDGHGVALTIPQGSPALAWRADLESAGVELDIMSQADVSAAFGYIVSAITEGTIRHRGQPELNNAVAGLTVKRSGDVDVPARRTSSTNIAPFVAAMCALYRVPTAKEIRVAEAYVLLG